MNGACQSNLPQLCGCCAGVGPETPQLIFNRSGLSRIAYRVGTYSSFNASMLAALSDPELLALGALRTRDPSDFTVALIDSYAVVADILSFYQERLANEAFLRTALDQRSVFSLAALVGFVPSPGVSASAYLAYTLNDAPGSPDNVLIPAGSRVQSVPGPGEKPQTFETSADVTATIAANAISPQTTLPWTISPGDTSTWIAGNANNLSVGDALLFVSDSLHTSLSSGPADFHLISAVTLDPVSGNTFVQWNQPIADSFPSGSDTFLYVLRKKTALFGSQAPNPWSIFNSSSNPAQSKTLPGFPDVKDVGDDWTFQYSRNSGEINLDSSIPGLAPVHNGESQWAVFVSRSYTALFRITDATETGPNFYTLTSKTSHLVLDDGQVLVNNSQSVASLNRLVDKISQFEDTRLNSLRWHNSDFVSEVTAPQQRRLDELVSSLTSVSQDDVLASIVTDTRNTTAYVQSNLLIPAAPPLISWDLGSLYPRQEHMLRPMEGTNIDLVGGQRIHSGDAIAISGKRLRLTLSIAIGASFVPDHTSGSLPVTAGQIFIVEAFPPTIDVAGNTTWQVLTLEGVAGSLHPGSSSLQLLPAGKKDSVVSESVLISETSISGAITTLTLSEPLDRIYDRSTVTVNANVVLATHGETMHEILGSGDATNPHLKLALKQSPLTFLSSPIGSGAQSTLEVWVNNLKWGNVDNLLSSHPADRVFVTHIGYDGKVVVEFGDGVEGARPPTGQLNIRTTYRKGVGAAGMVVAGQLSQAVDRPQGLSAVVNPDPASGGADPDTAQAARKSAPLHTLTLERVVSLEDYQNFALAFAGIATALATWTWFGRNRGIFLTIAGAGGAILKADDPTLLNLVKALRSSGNPYLPIEAAAFYPILFEIGASIRVDRANYDPTLVLAQVWDDLTSNFAFERRLLGQGVAQSEIIQIIQQVPGVIALELTAFNRQGATSTTPLAPVLRASAPSTGSNTVPSPAEMLLLDPASIANLRVWS
ncbi:putative baseplate assembly protein [Granulicella sp. dw_53]|uniref:putative baseplate assembly protein n=1 Tax=Granulicella sp. dw_53 TaxID=2719792 RepID=UPI001BD6C07E|nr:putative baseplate assembly protein [Granulicella sp. dw_53]